MTQTLFTSKLNAEKVTLSLLNMKFPLLIPFATLAISSSAESAIRGGTSTSFDSIDIEPSTVVYAAPVRSYGGQSSKDLWDEIAVRIYQV